MFAIPTHRANQHAPQRRCVCTRLLIGFRTNEVKTRKIIVRLPLLFDIHDKSRNNCAMDSAEWLCSIRPLSESIISVELETTASKLEIRNNNTIAV